MRIIQKQVSLEPMTSRLPGLYPAYKDGELYFFDEKHLKARGHEFPTNWGMIPVLLRLKKQPTEINCDSDHSIVSCTGTFTMSWERLSEWYYFFEEYYHLLNDYGHCGVKYKSAVDYYENESREKYAEQMMYGVERETYERLDEVFAERGGKAVLGKDSNNCPTGTTDTGFYCWLRKNIISTPETVQSNVDTINSIIEEELSDDCTGKWANDCFVPYMNGGINLQVTIDDIGEFGIFCSEYEMGVNYYSDVIYKDGKAMTIKSGQLGYKYDEIFKEMVINDVDWEDYTASYIDSHDYYIIYDGNKCYGKMTNNGDTHTLKIKINNTEYTARKDTLKDQWYVTINSKKYYFSSVYSNDFKCYGFKSDGTKVIGENEDDVKAKLITVFPAVEKPGVMIDGDIYAINEEEWVEYGGKRYYVFREKDTQTPYTYINGKKIYASLNTHNVTNICYTFSFADKNFGRERTSASQLEEYVLYDGGAYTFNSDGNIEIDGTEYSKVDGYFDSDIGTLYYKGDDVYKWYAMEMVKIEDVYTKDGNNFKKTDDNPIIYNTGQLTGVTSSKLETLVSTDALVDDAGYTLPGRYDFETRMSDTGSAIKNIQPKEGEELDLLYEVGNIANIMPYKKTKTLLELLRLDTPDKDKNYFIGDIITEMYFYYKDINGKKYNRTGWNISSLSTIKSVEKPTDVILENENIFCDITYLMGTTLVREKNGKFNVYTDGDVGVTYTETVEFEKKNVEYHLKDVRKKSTPVEKTKPSMHSISYPVICYVIKKEEVVIEGETRYVDNTAHFISDTFKCQNSAVDKDENDYVTDNTIIFPNLRFEYMFGSSTMQNVDANIYIDRGINAALDKHIKLGEVTSMEALENYTNGYFKMMNN